MSSLHINSISLELFKRTLARYAIIAPSTLADLDTLRYETIPAKLAKSKKDTHLPKADVEKLVEWKLKHGTFRPTLMNLVKSNAPDAIEETTRLGFLDNDPMRSLKVLASLRGIGPATASLLLSVRSPDSAPFFSDELFRWTHWDAPGKSGWERKIKYSVTEYKEILASVERLRKRLGVKAVDAEKVAYVLGRESVDVDGEIEGKGGAGEALEENLKKNGEREKGVEDVQEESRKRVQEALEEIRKEKANNKESGKRQEDAVVDSEQQADKAAKKQGTKRKAKEGTVPAEGARRSTRKKT
ncbi:uncharacterized protein M421DRAFT_423068 [Didymella exigua CBS 183.55]|uniref:Uncharacterized protein n=1 Tax=Didymella exigua CBS 183.55 TaxID=1150837 RepID=A0A6A5RF06_9PLEO|nr:uncharacterized protein M421DRAFT_423068 [Didymella exigua CBS 183.55]KAF1926063.1 hypothetical protein M421DRAFT_423068 [Didymella exigua CBS 183.55]